MLADVFENFKNKCIEWCELDPANFSSALGFAQQPCLKKTRAELELLTDIDVIDGWKRNYRWNMSCNT